MTRNTRPEADDRAVICVRSSVLEDLHAGSVPVTKTGDYSDVLDAGKR